MMHDGLDENEGNEITHFPYSKVTKGQVKSMNNLFKGPAQGTAVQLFRYLFVGGSAFAVDFATLFVLTNYLHIHYLISAGVAFIFGIIVNYALSTLWVFNQRTMGNRWMEVAVFTLIGGIGLGLNELLMYLFTDRMHVYYMMSKAFSTAIVFMWNFTARKFLLFRGKSNN